MSYKVTVISGKTPSPQRRFRDKNSIISWLSSSMIGKNVYTVSEVISSVPSYIDLSVSSFSTNFGTINSYLLVENEIQGLITFNFFAFVNKIEYSNTMGNVRYYFSIDWWDTLLYSDVFTCNTINAYGDIVRAHVNDVIKNGDNFYPTLENTTNEMEVLPDTIHSKYTETPLMTGYAGQTNVNIGLMLYIVPNNFFLDFYVYYNLNPGGGPIKINYSSKGLYYLPTIAHNSNGEILTTPNFRQISYAQSLSVIPIFYNKSSGELCKITYDENGVGQFGVSFKEGTTISDINTDQVAGVIYLPYLPDNIGYIEERNEVYINNTDVDYWFNNNFVFRVGKISETAQEYLKLNKGSYTGIQTDSFLSIYLEYSINFSCSVSLNNQRNIFNIFQDISTNIKNIDVSIKNDFDTYFEKGVIKYKSQAYNPSFLNVMQDLRPINYNRFTQDKFIDGFLDVLTGTVVARMYDEYSNGEYAKLNVCTTSWVTPPVVIDKYWDRYNAEISATKNGFGIAQGALQIGQGNFKIAGANADLAGNVLSAEISGGSYKWSDLTDYGSSVNEGAQNIVKGAENIAINSMELVRNKAYANGALVQGNVSSVPVSILIGQGEPKLGIITIDDNDLCYNLFLYGYNTHLNLNSVIKDTHKRKYYNFIRSSGCYILDAGGNVLTSEAKSDISSMFDKGVFLFTFVNSNSLFNLEVPNYCSIMDEVQNV